MVLKIKKELKDLLSATSLGQSRDHPLAGWNVLTILYGNRISLDTPRTFKFISNQYNNDYLNLEEGEGPISDHSLKKVLTILNEQAHLIEVFPRKIRILMTSGDYHMQPAPVYRITSSGIEYLNLIPKVLDAESTVTANTNRIDEYCLSVKSLNQSEVDDTTTKLFNDFHNMLSAYSDVMKGMHKLSDDLDELANDLAFDRGGKVAEHLQLMLNIQAIPALKKLLNQGPRIQNMADSARFSDQVARSRQGKGSFELSRALNDNVKLSIQFKQDKKYVDTQLQNLSLSFEPTETAIDSSYDSIYLIYTTILNAIKLLSQEYEHINKQTVDVQELTKGIDHLLQDYQKLSIPKQIPRHLAQDRDFESISTGDFLDATTMGPIKYQAVDEKKRVATIADNPEIADDGEIDSLADNKNALSEFKELVMQDKNHGRIDHDLEVNSMTARDEIVKLYSASGYDHYESFTTFGRLIKAVDPIDRTGELRIHCTGEKFSVFLPTGFKFQLGQMGDDLNDN